MRRLFALSLLGLGLSFAQPALSCDMHKGAKGGCGCKHCDEKSCGNEQAKNGAKACGCKMGADKAVPGNSKEKPAS